MPGAGSPDMSPTRYDNPTRSRSSSSYGTTAFLNFFFHRVTRSGPRLLLYLALLLASSLLVTKLLPTGISDSIATSTGHLWKLRPGLGGSGSNSGSGSSRVVLPPGENNEYDALAGGGLRIVVFGENDIATSMLQNIPSNIVLGSSNGTTWTRELCTELGCTTYLSYVPEVDEPRRSLTSNPLYGAVTDDIVREAKGATPANDYTYVKETYPISWEAADLYAQVSRFINQPAPRRAPKESVFVFSFGMWDVWSLAAFPYSHAEGIINILVSDIFQNIETLYDAAHDPESIAYSNYTSTPLEEVAINATLLHEADSNNKHTTRSSKSDLIWDDAGSDPFRVIVPLLFDPSLVPGWHLSRPDAPVLHTKPEQLRNAVRLTKRWNDYVLNEMENWTKKGVEFVHPEDRPKVDAAANNGENKDGEKAAPPNISGRDEPAPENTEAEKTESAENSENAEGSESTETKAETIVRPGQPMLLRDGIVFRMSDYVMDVIIDGQMKKTGLTDRKSFGKFFNAESYLEVDKPCLMPSSVGISPESKKISTKMHTVQEQREKAEAEVKPEEKSQNKPTKRSTAKKSAPSRLALEMCERPDRHLFFTPFSLGQRAIEEVGRMSAALVRANRGTRLEWEKVSRDSNGANRSPGSWKVYFMPS
ncbi:hypothetical protein F503_00642 [Ophiostoma piceae UAMH 11346]|uniref:Uncharacterized protein n=1 Tax=Ophiostoma piceae (strain UAMH 11346) TaxID=1262450 RepID=S3D3J6_OPHP1|nr:hypothetical protein F503_00642 [Ophiostoma piceae UAMH 11346]